MDAELFEQCHAVHGGHFAVADDDINGLLGQHLQCFGTIDGGKDLLGVKSGMDDFADDFAHHVAIIYNQKRDIFQWLAPSVWGLDQEPVCLLASKPLLFAD